MSLAEEGQNMMFAQTEYFNVLYDHHLVRKLRRDHLKKNFLGILPVAPGLDIE